MIARAAAAACAAMACGAFAEQPASPPPAFAPADLTPAGVRALAATCASCHGTDGHAAPGSLLPPLAGRSRGDVAQAMAQYREGARPATVMHQIAKGFTAAEADALDAYFARQKRAPEGVR